MILAMSASLMPSRRSRAVIRGKRGDVLHADHAAAAVPVGAEPDMVGAHHRDRVQQRAHEQVEIGGRIGPPRVQRGGVGEQPAALRRR